jgi:Domain of unknown function (DUF4214)
VHLVADNRDDVRNTISALYRGLLLRSPDAAGLDSFVRVLKSGEMTFAAVLDAFLRSTEFRANIGAFESHYVRAFDLRGIIRNLAK